MNVSRKWLQTFFEDDLPSKEVLEQKLLLHSFEIEPPANEDSKDIFVADILPNRTADCLCHNGIADELAALLSLSKKEYSDRYPGIDVEETIAPVLVEIAEPSLCRRYVAAQVDGLAISDSPAWLSDLLVSTENRTVNNCVDVTNYVMLDLGQPTHVFDADKVSGSIQIRLARDGEHIRLLGEDDERILSPDMLVIADDDGPLAIAGVKGGAKAEVDKNTENIIIESANFDPISVRKTRQTLGISTDASKRFENSVSPALAGLGLDAVLRLVLSMATTNDTKLSGTTDVGDYVELQPSPVVVTLSQINNLLGTELSAGDVTEILNRMRFDFTKDADAFSVLSPELRNDINIAEDLIEEIGRVHGYDLIMPCDLSDFQNNEKDLSWFYFEQAIRNFLIENGYSEIETTSFASDGELQTLNPVNKELPFVRANLADAMEKSLAKNVQNAELFNLDIIKLFELGRIFSDGAERTGLCIGVQNVNKSAKKKYGDADQQVEKILYDLSKTLDLELVGRRASDDGVVQIEILPGAELPPEKYSELYSSYPSNAKFDQFSSYPFILRDISFWNLPKLTKGEVLDLIRDVSALPVHRIDIVDSFEKDGKQSLAFRIVFQSHKRTLQNEEVNAEMKKIEDTLIQKGCEIR